jgi:hypothetical protein
LADGHTGCHAAPRRGRFFASFIRMLVMTPIVLFHLVPPAA